MDREPYVISTEERYSEVVRLSVRAKGYGWRWIDVGDHACAVLVLGADQVEADARAAAIVKAMA